jgi:predicted secreted hydrolase
VRIDDWFLERDAGGYRTRAAGPDFALDLTLTPTQPVLLQGDRGYSRKGVGSGQASYYYSEPHLRVSGLIKSGGAAHPVTGTAWLDHEWSSALLASDAVGWDWLGANLDDGAALMAFRMRAQDGTTLWANATFRPAQGAPVTFGPEAVKFSPRRTWKSPRTGAVYPVAMDIEAGGRTYRIEPLMDDQELDARSSTGTIYWEGAVRVDEAQRPRGRGYLELTGYAGRLTF